MAPDSNLHVGRPMLRRQCMIRRLNDELASDRERWLKRAAFFHSEDLLYLSFLIPEGLRVLELGCGTGHLLAALKPSFGVGVDFSEGMIAQARKAYPHLSFQVGDIEDAGFIGTFLGRLTSFWSSIRSHCIDDCQNLLRQPASSVHARDQAGHRLFLPSLVSSTKSGGSGQAAHAAAFFLECLVTNRYAERSSNLPISNRSRARSGCSLR